MATIMAQVGVAMRVRIRLPISPDRELLEGWFRRAEGNLTELFAKAVQGAVAALPIPGVSIEVVTARTVIKSEDIKT